MDRFARLRRDPMPKPRKQIRAAALGAAALFEVIDLVIHFIFCIVH